MMRSIFYAMLVFSILAISSTQQTSGDWQTNKDIVDLIIAIHYVNGVTQPSKRTGRDAVHYPALREMLKGLAAKLTLGAEKTSIGILEFGYEQDPTWLVSLGANVANWNDGINKRLGRAYLKNSTHLGSLDAVVTKTHEEAARIDTPERRYVPQLIMVVTEVADGQLTNYNDSAAMLKTTLGKLAGWNRMFHLVLMEGFDRNENEEIKLVRMGGLTENEDAGTFYYNMSYSAGSSSQVGSELGDTIIASLAMCRFKQVDRCYVNDHDGCVIDRHFTLAYVPFTNPTAHPNEHEWRNVSMYCFKNASTPCPQENCPTTSTSASTSSISSTTGIGSTGNATSPSSPITSTEGIAQDDESDEVGDDFVWNDDPVYIAAKQRLIGSAIAFFVVLVIVTPIVIYGAIEYRKYRAALAKLPAADALGGQQSQVSDPWTLVAPPELTITPASQLYVGNKSSKSSKSQKKTA